MSVLTTPALDTRLHAAAIKTALTATLGANRAFDFDEVPGTTQAGGTLPDIYVAITIERRFMPSLRSGGSAGRSGWRVSCRFVGRDVDEARWAELKTAAALDEARLTVDGTKTTRIHHEVTTVPEKDDGRWSGLSQWTYVV